MRMTLAVIATALFLAGCATASTVPPTAQTQSHSQQLQDSFGGFGG